MGLSSQEFKVINHLYDVLTLTNEYTYAFLSNSKHFRMNIDSRTH